jgi:CheY-like chemotaxis protein
MRSAAPRPRFVDFQDLMRHRVMDILLVAPPYDAYVLEEAGELSERMLGEFRNLDLHYAPGLTSVATGAEALELAREQRRFNLILTTPRLADMNAVELARRVRAEGLDAPVVLLGRDLREVADFQARHGSGDLERAFVWQGDARILVAIVKSVEDRRNVEHDSGAIGVQVILLVEDGVRQYSSFLPAMYGELLHHSQRVIAEGLNLAQKILRMRARPKILLATNWEEAEAAFERYAAEVLGVVSDVEFPRDGVLAPLAGAELVRLVRARYPDIPVLLHSSKPEYAELAFELGARFLLKGAPHLLADLGEAMLDDFGFGDFVFRLPDGTEVDRAGDLRALEAALARAPAASVVYHASRNHFSRWLKARTEFAVAEEIRPHRPEEFPDAEALRAHLALAISHYRAERDRALVADFDRASFDFGSDFYRLGGGSLGGKGRGLAFVRRLLAERGLRRAVPGLEIAVPEAVVVGTAVFDQFLDENDLRDFAFGSVDDEELFERFSAARLPTGATSDLGAFLERARYPLAVRSSSLLEDSAHHPFTGVYETLVLANDHPDPAVRLERAAAAIRRVYASVFTRAAQAYLAATTYRLEEEKMAVILQRVVGERRRGRFYPTLSGVARSHNFYPLAPMKTEDGIAAVALGLGRTIVDGEPCLRFSPRFPHHLPQLASAKEALATTQRRFWALPLGAPGAEVSMREAPFGLDAAEEDGTLAAVGSTYSHENDALSDGLARAGARVVTFAPVLKQDSPPLAPALELLLAEGARAMGTAVELEFAAEPGGAGAPAELALLQMRPLALASESESVEIETVEDERLLCRSRSVLGNGRIEGLHDVVVVDPALFERAKSREVAETIGRMNAALLARGAPYVLVGVGRWGSRDPWLGIPVGWEQVSGARVFVEARPRDLEVTPSQGSHFFQNLTAFDVGYFSVDAAATKGFVDWSWLAAQPALEVEGPVRRLRLSAPLVARIDGRRGAGVIEKPAPDEAENPGPIDEAVVAPASGVRREKSP